MTEENRRFFREQIANELTRDELIDRLCELNEQYRDLREEYFDSMFIQDEDQTINP